MGWRDSRHLKSNANVVSQPLVCSARRVRSSTRAIDSSLESNNQGPASTDARALHSLNNTVCLHAGIGYVTPGQEHRGEGAIRAARRAGLTRARAKRIAYQRTNRTRGPADAD